MHAVDLLSRESHLAACSKDAGISAVLLFF
jgi:hypothetical protein